MPGWEGDRDFGGQSFESSRRRDVDPDKLHLRHPDLLAPRNFSTVAGLVLTRLDRIPTIGESVTWLGLQFEVVDMDGPRIDRVWIRPEDKKTDE